MKKDLFFFLTALLFFGSCVPCRAENANIMKIGGDISIEEGEKVKNAVAVGGQITVKGTVTGHLMAVGGSVVLTRTAIVEGNVISVGGVIVMGKGARVYGNLKEINASDISQSLAAVLNEDWVGWSWVFAVLSLLVFVGILLLSLLFVTLLPKPVCVVSAIIKDSPFRVFLWGIAVLVSVAPLAILLTISVVGIVLIPLEMTMVVGATFVGFVAVAQLIGEKIFLFFKKRDQSIISDVSIGLVILWLVGWIPHIGWMVKVIAVVLGLGGVSAACLGARQQWKKTHVNRGMD